MPRNERAERSPRLQRDIFATVKHELQLFEKAGAFQPRVLPALRLYAYNFFSKNQAPTEEQRAEFTQTCRSVNQLESVRATEAAARSLLPTIGTEIEWFIPQEHREILNRLENLSRKNNPKIQVVPGVDDDPTGPLWELNLPWTYAAETQAFMIAQLAEMGMFDPKFGEGQPQQTIGMHLNFGAPSYIAADQLTDQLSEERIEDVNDALILAYTSAQRLSDRKTHTSYDNRKQTEGAKQASMRGRSGEVYRLELRAFEVTQDMNITKQLLSDSQYLVGGLFQWIRMRIPYYKDLDGVYKSIAEEFGLFSGGTGDFHGHISDLKEALGIADNFADVDKQKATELVRDPAIVQAFRGGVREMSSHIRDFIHPEDVDEE